MAIQTKRLACTVCKAFIMCLMSILRFNSFVIFWSNPVIISSTSAMPFNLAIVRHYCWSSASPLLFQCKCETHAVWSNFRRAFWHGLRASGSHIFCVRRDRQTKFGCRQIEVLQKKAIICISKLIRRDICIASHDHYYGIWLVYTVSLFSRRFIYANDHIV